MICPINTASVKASIDRLRDNKQHAETWAEYVATKKRF